MNQSKRATSVWLTDSQKQKLSRLASALSMSNNAMLAMLVDNAEIRPVTRHEAVAVLEGAGEETPPRKAKRPVTTGAGGTVLD